MKLPASAASEALPDARRLEAAPLADALLVQRLHDGTAAVASPPPRLAHLGTMMDGRGGDPGAPRRLDSLEDRLTVQDEWKAAVPR
ncbi:hypothetical protein [Caldimonas tepidiphila]|uniref:hypothetical protein n=1 Tax=Caldimonas tepidiphila TaxID=2315841 RepID=UPI0013004FFF|nr:hypothetical protein [Caldimonas tepidiphila]